MNKVEILQNVKKVHLIGIGGVSMSAIAIHLKDLGFVVSGSDKNNSLTLKRLKTLGIETFYGHSKENLKDDCVVIVSSAISNDNPELEEAKKRGLTVFSRSEVLGEILKNYKKVIGVSGSHGKTTTTAMIGSVLDKAKVFSTVFLGGEYKDMVNYKKGSSDFAVVECCEYQKNFLNIYHNYSVVLNVDNDHLDSYLDMQDMVKSFNSFCKDTLAFINIDDKYAQKLNLSNTVKFGTTKGADFRALSLREKGGKYSFSVYYKNKRLTRIKLNVIGKHNVINALSVFAVLYTLEIPANLIKEGLEEFTGAKRRMEILVSKGRKEIIFDYAHHPTEILATINALKNTNDTLFVFQPHTYSRTKILMNEFVQSFKDCKNLFIYKTYSAREKYMKLGSAKTLNERLLHNGINSKYYNSKQALLIDLFSYINNKCNRVVFLGAGNIYQIAKNFSKEMTKK